MNDCYGFILLYLNLFYLEQKFDAELDREYVNMIWYSVMPNLFYDFICRDNNYATLKKLRLRFQDTIEIAKRYTDSRSSFQMLSDVLRKHAHVFQFVFGNLFLATFHESMTIAFRADWKSKISIRLKKHKRIFGSTLARTRTQK